MKAINPLLFDELRRLSSHISMGWLLTRRDGVKIGFTSYDEPFTYQGVVYEPTNAFSGTAAVSKNNLSVDNMSAVTLLTEALTARDLTGGRWDNAEVKVFWIRPDRPEWGIVPIRGGTLGEIKLAAGKATTEIRSLTQRLQQPFGKRYTLECPHILGDDKCRARIFAQAWGPGRYYMARVSGEGNIGAIVKPSTYNGFWYMASNGPTAVSIPWGFTKPQVKIGSVINRLAVGLTAPTPVVGVTPAGVTAAVNYLIGAMHAGTAPADLEPVISRVSSSLVKQRLNDMGVTNDYVPGYASYVGALPQGAVPSGYTSIFMPAKYGISGSSEPVWPTTLGSTVTDGTVTWTAIRARQVEGVVSDSGGRGTFSDDARTEGPAFFQYGLLTWLTGGNAGLSIEVTSFSRKEFTLLEIMPETIRAGDTYRVGQGCAKTRTICKTPAASGGFDNLHNYGGFPDMPTEEVAMQTPNIAPVVPSSDDGGSK